MSENRYAPPEADVALPAVEPQVPEATLRKIRHAWIAGLISSGMTLLLVLLAVGGTSIAGFTGWEIVDVALILGLTFGIYRKSRICAVLMLVYFVVSKVLLIAETGQVSGILLTLVFFYYYAHGVVGTFAYHKQAKPQAGQEQAAG